VLRLYGPEGLKLGGEGTAGRGEEGTGRRALPARQKANIRERRKDENTFGQWAEEWLERYMMAESTRDMRRSVRARSQETVREAQVGRNRREKLRRLCDRIVARGAPATAVQAREVVMLLFRYAREREQKVANPADEIRPSSIARFQPRERSLTSEEVRLVFHNPVATTGGAFASGSILLITYEVAGLSTSGAT